MKNLILTISSLLVAVSSFGQAISTRNLDTNFFKTQTNVAPYNITWNTNAGSGASNYIETIVRSNSSPQLWTNDNGTYTLVQTNNALFQNGYQIGLSGSPPWPFFNVYEQFNYPGAVGPSIGRGGNVIGQTNVTARLSVTSDGVIWNSDLSFTATDDGNNGIAQAVVLLPHGGPAVTLFSTNNVLGSSGLFVSTNTAVRDDGTLKLNNIEYVMPATNGAAGQALVTDGNTPQQLSWATLSAGAGALWFTNATLGKITNLNNGDVLASGNLVVRQMLDVTNRSSLQGATVVGTNIMYDTNWFQVAT